MSKNYYNHKKTSKNYSEKIIEYKNGKVYNNDKNVYNDTINNTNNNQVNKYRKLSQKEQDDIAKRIYSLVKNKVNFISGTVAPAPSSKRENYLNIEDLRIGLNLISESYLNDFVLSIQPKFMGSRCNIYLNCENIDLSYSVSRNGYLIGTDRVDMKSIYEKLFLKLQSWIIQNNVRITSISRKS